MELTTIKQYAKSQNVSYEAVRKQIVRYGEELKDHIIRKDRTQYLDEWAIDFLTKRRRENPVILLSQDKDEEIEALRDQVESLRSKLLNAQNELLKSHEERLKAQDRIIELQDEAKQTLEDRAKYSALLEDNHLKETKLREAESRIEDLQKEHEEDREALEKVQDLREEDRKKIEDLQRERDEALTEAQSFKRSIFGFYRKR